MVLPTVLLATPVALSTIDREADTREYKLHKLHSILNENENKINAIVSIYEECDHDQPGTCRFKQLSYVPRPGLFQPRLGMGALLGMVV
jgi:hypothetical protein